MFKKISLILLSALLVPASLVLADTTVTTGRNARSIGVDSGVNQIVAVAGARSKKTIEIDSRGAASVFQYPQIISSNTGKTLNDGVLIRTGAARVSSITVGGFDTTAGDYVLVYDATSATGTAKFDIAVGTAKDTVSVVIPGGAIFSTGIFADSNVDTVHAAITYDQ